MEFKLEFEFCDMVGSAIMYDNYENLEEAITHAHTIYESNSIIESVTIYCLDQVFYRKTF